MKDALWIACLAIQSASRYSTSAEHLNPFMTNQLSDSLALPESVHILLTKKFPFRIKIRHRMGKNLKLNFNAHHLAGIFHHGGHHRLIGSASAMMVSGEIKE
jgi:hypothetical protein